MAYNQGESVNLRLLCYSDSDKSSLTNIDWVKVTLTDPDDTTLIDEGEATRDATGTYDYNYNLSDSATVGVYDIKWEARSNARSTIEWDSFVVEE